MHSLVINTNVPSIVAQNATKYTDRQMSNTMEKLSTGYRINDAGDDAATEEDAVAPEVAVATGDAATAAATPAASVK